MANEEPEGEEPKKKKGGGGGLIVQLATALVMGGAAFAVIWFLPARAPSMAECPVYDGQTGKTMLPELSLAETAFVEMEPVIITLGEDGSSRHLRIGITLETSKVEEADVAFAAPKLRDAFTGYLRAIEVADIEDPNSMVRLRAQLLRRAEVILGNQSVRSVLITDFVIR